MMDNTNQQIPSQPQPPASPAGSSKLVPVILVIALLVVVGVGAYMFGKGQANMAENQQSSVAPTTIPTPTPLPAEALAKEGDETANWKTYANKNYGFSIKYPSDFIYEEQTSDIFLLLTSFKNPLVIQSNGFYVEVRSLEKLENAVNYERSSVVGHSSDRINRETRTTKEGFEAIKLEYSTLDDKDFTAFIVNNNKYTYTLNAPTNLFDQILSTFKFTDQ